MTMTVTITNKGPEQYVAVVSERYRGIECGFTEKHLKIGESVDVTIYDIKDVVVKEIPAQGE